MDTTSASTPTDFIREIVRGDLAAGHVSEVITRFPPEPNGYLHIGHAKSICINFEIAKEFGGKTNLRFDDTNPLKEDVEYVNAIKEDVAWLGFEWAELNFASNYFEEMYQRAVRLIENGKAYVDDLSADEMRVMRGTLTEPGQDSPYRSRSATENLDLFARMRAGEFADGAKVLRAKIDMSSPNINMRDPVLYRISHSTHHNTGDKWCIYPMYAFAHPLEDAIEGVSHSLCTLEFRDQRPLYDWVVRECEMPHVPHQYEFGRLSLTDTMMSKRYIKQLVDEQVVDGWDDPRLPTISGLRRRGFTPEAIRAFVRDLGVTLGGGDVDYRMLEHYIREDLKLKVPRTMGVIRPLKVVITNYPEGQVEWLDAEINPEVPEMGIKKIAFSREIYIEQDDFMEVPVAKYFRLFPGNEVRLKHAYFIKCNDVVKDEHGHVTELHCTYDPETKSGSGFTGRKVKGTIHWVDASSAVPAEFRLYQSLLKDQSESAVQADQTVDTDVDAVEDSKQVGHFLDRINPDSLTIEHGYIEADLRDVQPQAKFQFFRHGYFNVDPKDTTGEHKVFNLIVSLKSSFQVKTS